MAKISRWTVGASVVSVALLAASLAAAQAPQIVRVRATIESVSGQTLSVKSRDGACDEGGACAERAGEPGG